MKTQAAILVEIGMPLVIAELDVPALKPGQVLVEIAFSGACGSQVNEVCGNKGPDRWVPHCLGHEATGRVLEVGGGVTKVKQDDHVVLSWLRGTGIEAGGCVYGWGDRQVNAGAVTTFQRHAVVSENRLTLAPKNLDLDVAVLLGCAAPTGMGAVMNVLHVRAGDSVAIFGSGGIGLNACMAAAFSGAMPVIAIDPNPSRRAAALRYGASHVLDPAACDVAAEIKSLVGVGVDVAVEASGNPAVMAQALAATRPQGGRAVVIGNARHDARLTLDPATFNEGKSLLGTWGGDSQPDRDFGRFAKLLAATRFPVRDLLSKPYRLDEVDKVLADLSAGRVGRPIIDMSQR